VSGGRIRWRATATTAGAALVGLAIGAAAGLRIVSARAAVPHALDTSPSTTLVVPRATSTMQIDGELEELAWNDAPARTGPLLHGGEQARPYSDARALWGNGMLYLALYAADEDISAPATAHDQPLWTGDAFQLVFRRDGVERSIDVSPRGTVSDGERRAGAASFDARWESRAKVAVDQDGTVDDPSDVDEEWIVEMAIPLDALGLRGEPGERIGLDVRRCDRVRGNDGTSHRTCASWGDGDAELELR